MKKRTNKTEDSQGIFIDAHSEIGILLLHGFTSSPSQFAESAGFLADRGFTVYAPTIAGHGATPQDLYRTSIKDWKESVSRALDRLRKKVKRVYLAGTSFGGNLAFYLVANTDGNTNIKGVISLATPIWTHQQRLVKLRLYTYGYLKRYHPKPTPKYPTGELVDCQDVMEEKSYSLIPLPSLRRFYKFIKQETIPNLSRIKIPVLVVQSKSDPVVDCRSAQYIYDHIFSGQKEILWLDSCQHSITRDANRLEVFQHVCDFIEGIESKKKKSA